MLELNKVHLGDCIEVIKKLPDNSIDAIVTDPPYELGFMGKGRDKSGIANSVELWSECLRVIKPGGHLLAFSGTRTYHRMAVAIEDAGFEIRDMLERIYASGFPKSQNIGKAYDKKMGNEREDLGLSNSSRLNAKKHNNRVGGNPHGNSGEVRTTKGNSPYEGLGTGLKPAHEPICMARKPLSEKTIVDNVVKWGTGGIDIDGCRIPTAEKMVYSTSQEKGVTNFGTGKSEQHNQGRFPANILCQDDALNDGEMTKSVDTKRTRQTIGSFGMPNDSTTEYSDSGSKSRYFDIDVRYEKHGLLQFPKASKSERNKGCEGLEERPLAFSNQAKAELKRGNDNFDGGGAKGHGNKIRQLQNNHPTVKNLALMSWLIRLVSKPGDIVLEPFAGSGTTCVACVQLDRKFIGIEMTEEYIPICEARIKRAEEQIKQKSLF